MLFVVTLVIQEEGFHLHGLRSCCDCAGGCVGAACAGGGAMSSSSFSSEVSSACHCCRLRRRLLLHGCVAGRICARCEYSGVTIKSMKLHRGVRYTSLEYRHHLYLICIFGSGCGFSLSMYGEMGKPASRSCAP